METLSFKITSDHFLLCLFLSLLWGITETTAASTGEATSSSEPPTTSSTSLTKTMTPPRDAEGFKSLAQTETSITLRWKNVDATFNYTLVINGEEIIVTATAGPEVKHTIRDLTNGTKYNFQLFTVFEYARSTGVNLTAVTAPPNAEGFKSLAQTETSITLGWKNVDATFNYTLVIKGEEMNVPASADTEVKHTIPDLPSGTKYNFQLFTVFEYARSTGVNLTAVTAPLNTENVKSVEQTETSITLRWKNVDATFNYTLVINGEEIIVTATAGPEVKHTIPDLTNGTKYNFQLFTVFEYARSTGVNLTAVTAPPNAEGFKSLAQTETSITLGWKNVDATFNYTLVIKGEEMNVPASADTEVKHTIPDLPSGTKYNFQLFTVFEYARSTGVNLTAVTAPLNTENVKSVEQTETSITLRWKNVDATFNYTLVINGEEIIVTATAGPEVKHTIPDLTNGTKYNFQLFTVFEYARSTGVNLTAVTAPLNTENVKSVEQTETSITLRWKNVDATFNYTLVINGEEIIVTATAGPEVKHTIPDLTNGTKYNFQLFTVFEYARSTGVNLTAVTAPLNTENVKSVEQTETSITLRWKNVDATFNYTLVINGEEIIVTATAGPEVKHTIPDLTNGTKYNFQLFTVFEYARSTGVNLTAVTAPLSAGGFRTVTQNETSITLQWDKVDDIINYTLGLNGKEIIVTATADIEVKHTTSQLTSGTKYKFQLFTVFEYAKSTVVNHTAVTAPRNTEEFKSVGQNETSITLQWNNLKKIFNYTLVFNEKEINVPASEELLLTQTISELTSGIKYELRLFTVFENVNSTGVNYTAVTAPRNTEELESVGQNETSITLQWRKVNAILNYTLVINTSMINVSASEGLDKVKYVISNLTSGTKYNVSLLTVFVNVKSTGVNYFADTVPSTVDSVHVTERSVTNITLMWHRMKNDWDYRLEMNGENRTILQSRTMDEVSHSIPNLEPGTEYPFRVITLFSGLSSIAYEGFTVTGIDCANGNWHVTTSSIQGTVRGLFSSAEASNTSTQINGSTGNSSVSFSGLYPGATYNVTLQYEKNVTTFEQCRHTVTIVPPYLRSSCEYSAAGYSMSIIWNKPEGIWTSVEVNVTGKTLKKLENGKHSLDISGFLPARKYEVSIASVSGDVRSDEPFVFSCLTDPRGVIAGSFFAVLIFAVLVCLVVFIFLKRPDIIRKKQFIGGSRQSKEKSKAIPVAKFPDHFYQLGVDENRGFSQEYESLIPVGTDQTRNAATLPENKPRNRFNNVLPYDWCRVKLDTPNPNGNSDYINASYMPGYNSSKDYIACQGPLPTTVNHFWRMIWEQRVKGIVMVTNCTEGGRTKCERYWPADSKPVPQGELIVTLRSERQEPDWTLREFRVKNRNNSEQRTVKHFHFTAWPDHGVPEGTEVLIQFRGLVRRHIERDGAGAPTVVHCSAGVGRTGTIMALDVLLQQLEKERAVGINGFVHKMRLSRPHMVQTESQYVFLHHCIMDCLQPHENTEENIYENTEENIYENEDMIYANATALREFPQQKNINYTT
ncbi:receptor-type tyrosine-protein phosphatase H-like isoform X2 [Gymnodraco acuticeps]|uniref:protein-tyrosine-phosphatase n=1 Tax=Gymnodraco acuticeps TaxID=8218 RepID=A0A6P8U0W2_GYMAC|nr:receptor-type tyrosine-protein phosphatase H-like isoform X2 [Gymnodraco acuticeps]